MEVKKRRRRGWLLGRERNGEGAAVVVIDIIVTTAAVPVGARAEAEAEAEVRTRSRMGVVVPVTMATTITLTDINDCILGLLCFTRIPALSHTFHPLENENARIALGRVLPLRGMPLLRNHSCYGRTTRKRSFPFLTA